MIPTKTDSIQVEIEIGSILEPRTEAKACLIWMHGLGAESMDMEMLVHSLPLSDLPLRHIFLNAPIRPVALNGGMEMRAWYDVAADFSLENEDKKGILASEKNIQHIINSQITEGISANAIGLAGFSQGGAMALYAGLHYKEPLAGIASLSAYLPLSSISTPPLTQTKTPVFMGAGLHDKVVHCEWSRASQMYLENLGYEHIDFHAYPMEHCVCMDEARDLAAWIRKCFHFE